jgi:hypothetical protein
MKTNIKKLTQFVSKAAIFSAIAVSSLSIDRANATQIINTFDPIVTDVILPKADVKIAGWWEDWVTPNTDRFRSETFGRLSQQTYVGELSAEQIENLKVSQGGDWQSTVTDWCNGLVSQSYTVAVPYLTSTWRVENGNANCYARTRSF